MAEVLSPLVPERIWALPVSGASIKFLCYLLYRLEFGGAIPVRHRTRGPPRRHGATAGVHNWALSRNRW